MFGPQIRFLAPPLPVVSQFSLTGPCPRNKSTYESIFTFIKKATSPSIYRDLSKHER